MFFDEVEDFECPECGAPRSAFYDANDKDDPHNIKVLYLQRMSGRHASESCHLSICLLFCTKPDMIKVLWVGCLLQ